MSKADFNSRLSQEEINEYQAESFRQFLKELLPDNSNVQDVYYSEQRKMWCIDYCNEQLSTEHESFFKLVSVLVAKGTFNTEEFQVNIQPFAL